MPDNVNWDASDSDNVKLNYHYADLIEKRKNCCCKTFVNV